MKNINGYVRMVMNTGNGEINYRFFSDNSNISTSTSRQVGFRTSGATLYATCGNGTAETATALFSPVSNTFYNLRAECIDGTSVTFYVDGVIAATHTTNVPPASSGSFGRLVVGAAKITNYAANNYMGQWIADAGITYQPY